MNESYCFQQSIKQNRLLLLSYESIHDYLSLLELVSKRVDILKERVCFYLAAAVSDFYIPISEVSSE